MWSEPAPRSVKSSNGIVIPGMPASRKKRATSDQPRAASVPSEISVSIVAAPWRRFCQAALWKGQPPQSTTGVASCSASHCQFSNCSGSIIESSRTGSESAAAKIRRRRRSAVGSAASGSSASSASAPGAEAA